MAEAAFQMSREQIDAFLEAPRHAIVAVQRDDLAWRIVRRYYDSDEGARSWQAEVAARGRQALVVVAPERILGRDYN